MFRLKKITGFSQFSAVSIIRGKINEKVFLEGTGIKKSIDISEIHSPLCLYPLIIGVIINPEVISIKKNFIIKIFNDKLSSNRENKTKTDLLAKINLTHIDFIELGNNLGILLLKINKSHLYQPGFLERYRYTIFLYLHFLRMKKKKSFSFLNNLTAIYFYPRKTILNIIKTTSHYNIFPMDFICESLNEEVVLLGLNSQNRSIDEIINTKKMLIIEVDSMSKDIVYGFAGNHKEEILKPEYGADNKYVSEKFQFPFPHFTVSYKEISCRKHLKLGSHFLLICDVINKTELTRKISLLYHISSVRQLYHTNHCQLYPIV